MSSGNIVIVGSSGHAKVVMDIIEKEGRFRIAGVLDSHKKAGDQAFDHPILGAETDLPALMQSLRLTGCIIAIGDNWKRHLIAEKVMALAPALEFVSAVHPSAQIARGVAIGRGSAIMAGAILNSDGRVGEFCIVNCKASLDHDSIMENYSSLAPGATTGGNVHIGEFSAVSLGANIIHSKRIGRHSVIGAGALVLDDIPEYSIAYGIPAKVMGTRREGDAYL